MKSVQCGVIARPWRWPEAVWAVLGAASLVALSLVPWHDGLIHLNGAGASRDPKEAALWLRVSADAGDSRARLELASLILKGLVESHPEDLARARDWLEGAAASGNPVAALNLGLCLLERSGVEPDERQAAQWLRRAADGIAIGQYWYGRVLVEGRGVGADAEAGRAWIAGRRSRRTGG